MRYVLITAFVLASVMAAGCEKKPVGPKTTRLSPPVRSARNLAPAPAPKPRPRPILKPKPKLIVRTAPKPPLPPRQSWSWYTVKRGDKGFYSIARTQLGNPRRWKEIRDLNPGVDSHKLRIGQKIKIPVKIPIK